MKTRVSELATHCLAVTGAVTWCRKEGRNYRIQAYSEAEARRPTTGLDRIYIFRKDSFEIYSKTPRVVTKSNYGKGGCNGSIMFFSGWDGLQACPEKTQLAHGCW